MARHLTLIVERRRCLQQRCDERRTELVAAVHEVHDHWLPVERIAHKWKRFVVPGVLVGGLGARWLRGAPRTPRVTRGVRRSVGLLKKMRYLLPVAVSLISRTPFFKRSSTRAA